MKDSGADEEDAASGMPAWLAGLGGFGLLLWKGKFVLVFVFTKLKLLLTGLSKGGTAFTMLASVGVYWVAFGLPFALGLVFSIYLHEMGHVIALQHYGIRASAPMFVPGLGAYIRLDQHPATVVEDARTGMAGPVAGLLTALACYGVFLATSSPIFAAVAKLGAWVNLFNLFPIWQLDGGRAFVSMSRAERAWVALAILACFLWTSEGLLLLLLLGALFRLFGGARPEGEDRQGVALFIVVLVALSWLTAIDVPGIEALP